MTGHDQDSGFWPRLMAFAFGSLGLSPQVFWAMTPQEFEALARARLPAGIAGPSRSDLDGLMAAFPDSTPKE